MDQNKSLLLADDKVYGFCRWLGVGHDDGGGVLKSVYCIKMDI
jgi:hypothetical protein